MINRATKITVEYCPQEDKAVDFDQDCDGCKHYLGMNKDYEVLCDYGKAEAQSDV